MVATVPIRHGRRVVVVRTFMHIRHGRWVVYKALAAEKSVLRSQLIYFIAKVLISPASVAAKKRLAEGSKSPPRLIRARHGC